MRITLRQKLEAAETKIAELSSSNTKLGVANAELTLQSESLQRELRQLLRANDELKAECNRHRRNRVIAEARMAGFVEATNLFIKGGKVRPDGQN